MSKTRPQNFLVVLGREWRDGRFHREPAHCLKEQINNTVIISTPDASNLNDTHILDLMALTYPGPHLFLVVLEEGKQPEGELRKWEEVFGEDISHNMIYITDGPYVDNRLSGKFIIIKEHIIEGCEHIINEDNRITYSFGKFLYRRRKQIENKMAAETDRLPDRCSRHQDSDSPVPGGQPRSQQRNQVLLWESGSGKRKQIENKMEAETYRNSRHQDSHSRHQDSHSQHQDSHSQHQDSHSRHQDPHSRHQDYHSPFPGGQQKSRQLTLVLLGESGSGKSASGNTILGGKAFKSEPSSTPVTTECKMETKSVRGTEVKVIDTPDFFDDSIQEQSRHILRCRELCEGGLCVYLLVIQIGRFTEGERDILERFEKALDTRVRDRAIILFTRGDDLGFPIDDYVRNTNPHLQELIMKCGGRYNVFNNTILFSQKPNEKADISGWWKNQIGSNTTSHKTEVEKQVKELMGKIAELVQTTDRAKVPEREGEKEGCVII